MADSTGVHILIISFIGIKASGSNHLTGEDRTNKKEMRQSHQPFNKSSRKCLPLSDVPEIEKRKGKVKSIKTRVNCSTDSSVSSAALDGSCCSLTTDTSSSNCSSKHHASLPKSEDTGRQFIRNKKRKGKGRSEKRGNCISSIALQSGKERPLDSMNHKEPIVNGMCIDGSLQVMSHPVPFSRSGSEIDNAENFAEEDHENEHENSDSSINTNQAMESSNAYHFSSCDFPKRNSSLETEEHMAIQLSKPDMHSHNKCSINALRNAANLLQQYDEPKIAPYVCVSGINSSPFGHDGVLKGNLKSGTASSTEGLSGPDKTTYPTCPLSLMKEDTSLEHTLCNETSLVEKLSFVSTARDSRDYMKCETRILLPNIGGMDDKSIQDVQVKKAFRKNTGLLNFSGAHASGILNLQNVSARVQNHWHRRQKESSDRYHNASTTASSKPGHDDLKEKEEQCLKSNIVSEDGNYLNQIMFNDRQTACKLMKDTYRTFHGKQEIAKLVREKPTLENSSKSVIETTKLHGHSLLVDHGNEFSTVKIGEGQHIELGKSIETDTNISCIPNIDFKRDNQRLMHPPSVMRRHLSYGCLPKFYKNGPSYISLSEEIQSKEFYFPSALGVVKQLILHKGNQQKEMLSGSKYRQNTLLGHNASLDMQPSEDKNVSGTGKEVLNGSRPGSREAQCNAQSHLWQNEFVPIKDPVTKGHFNDLVEDPENLTILSRYVTDGYNHDSVIEEVPSLNASRLAHETIDDDANDKRNLSTGFHLSTDGSQAASVQQADFTFSNRMECPTCEACCRGISDNFQFMSPYSAEDLKLMGTSILKSVCTSYKYQIASEKIAKEIGTPLAEFERVLQFVSPIIDAVPHRESCTSHQSMNMACRCEIADVPLSRIWDWYDHPSNYGLEVKAKNFQHKGRFNIDGDFLRAYFTPSLSSIRLFGVSNICEACDSIMYKEANTSNIQVQFDRHNDYMNMDTLRTPLPKPSRSKGSEPPCSRLKNSSDLFATVTHQGCTFSEAFDCRNMKVIFEYFEDESPKDRRPMLDKVKELVKNESNYGYKLFGDPHVLESIKLGNLHPASWFSIAWYPIYRIPEGPLHAAFLTYHSFGHFVYENIFCNHSSSESHCIKMPVVGLKTYRTKAEGWLSLNDETQGLDAKKHLDPSDVLTKRLSSLEQTASTMSESCMKGTSFPCREHSDYNYFHKRPWLS